MDSLAPWGNISIKKAFGIKLSSRKQIHNELLFHNFEIAEIPHIVKKKNSADIHITIEVMDVIHSKKGINTIVLASGDGDFSSLVRRLHQQKLGVIGLGERDSTSQELIKLCDVFLYYEDMKIVQQDLNITQIIPSSSTIKIGEQAMRTILRKRNVYPPTPSIRKQILLRLQRLAQKNDFPVDVKEIQVQCINECAHFASKTAIRNVIHTLIRTGTITTEQQEKEKYITAIPDFDTLEKAYSLYQIECLLGDESLVADPLVMATLIWEDPSRIDEMEECIKKLQQNLIVQGV